MSFMDHSNLYDKEIFPCIMIDNVCKLLSCCFIVVGGDGDGNGGGGGVGVVVATEKPFTVQKLKHLIL